MTYDLVGDAICGSFECWSHIQIRSESVSSHLALNLYVPVGQLHETGLLEARVAGTYQMNALTLIV